MKTLTPAQFKAAYKGLSPVDLEVVQNKLTAGGNVVFYQDAGHTEAGLRKYRLYVVIENANPVMRGKPQIEDVTWLLSNLIGDGYSKTERTLRVVTNIHQWDTKLNAKLDRDLRNFISFLSVS